MVWQQTRSDENQDIAKGRVKEVGEVSGYGGLIVLENQLEQKVVTTYYGHIDLKSLTLKVGDSVNSGQKIANLGDHCSKETSFKRKHLHFAVHQGDEIDLRGYIQNESELNSWLEPQSTLINLGAKEPQ